MQRLSDVVHGDTVLEANNRAKFQVFNACKIANLFPYCGMKETEEREEKRRRRGEGWKNRLWGRLSLFGNGSYFKHYAFRMMHDFVKPQMLYDPKTVCVCVRAMCILFEVYILFELNRALRPEHNRFGISLWYEIVFNQTETTISHLYE